MGGVLIEDGKILEILDRPMAEISAEITEIDAAGKTISPGFVDIHVHGGAGFNFLNASPDNVNKICKAHGKFGTTSIVPTTPAAPIETICDAIDNIRMAAENATGRDGKRSHTLTVPNRDGKRSHAPTIPGPDILGINLEGPFFSQEQRGAQPTEFIINPTQDNIEKLLDHWPGGIRMMGAAPEIEGGHNLGRELTKRGIIASIAHSNSTFEDVERAIEFGYSDVTHIYSGCSIVHRVNAYRTAGLVEAGLYFDELTAQVISDGKHLPPSLLRLIYKCKGTDRIALISDGTEASVSGLTDGTIFTQQNGEQFIIEDGVVMMMDRQAFAGSCATMSRCVQNMAKIVPLLDAVKMASQTPANVIGARHKGRLSPGCDADIILFDKNIDVSFVMVRGQVLPFEFS